MTDFCWATVTSIGPLRIKLDGDTAALPVTPDSLVDQLTLIVNDRVRVELAANRLIVIGKAGAVIPTQVPVATIAQTALAAAPTGWLLCDGSAVSRTTYAALFAAIGTTFGVGNGSTTFNVPNLRGRVIAGFDSGQAEFNVLGMTGGAKTHSHTLSSVIAALWVGYWKTRSGSSWTATNSGGLTAPGSSSTSTNTGASVEGSTDASANLPPYMALNHIIRF
jgi:microcystin-dependent protein